MQIFRDSWRAKAEAKIADIRSRIPDQWRLNEGDRDMAKKQRKLNGQFFQSFLRDSDLEILRNDSVQLVNKIKAKDYTALEVTQAYCKAAAIAQQIVSHAEKFYSFYYPLAMSNMFVYAEPLDIEQLFARNHV